MRSFTRVLLAVLLVPGLPSAGGAATAPTSPTATLQVDSDPAGAAVYVDGALQGATPVAVPALAPGDHRVRVVKEGYLDNSRVVRLSAGQAHGVRVPLTPSREPAGIAAQVDPTTPQKSGGSGKKIALIAGGAVLAGATVYLLTKESNKPPVAGTVTANPSTGLQGATSVAFSATASDPDGDTLTYDWNFGDGGTGSGASPTHVYTAAGAFNVTVTVKDPKGLTATASTSVTIRGLAGTWRGSLIGATATGNFTQSGTSVTGSWTIGGLSGTLTGTVSSPRSFNITFSSPGFAPFVWSGSLDTALNVMTGSVQGSGFTGETMTLTRQ